VAVRSTTGAGTGAEEFPRRADAQIRMAINENGKPINSNMAIAPKPSMDKPPAIMTFSPHNHFFIN
jgi:hypothetical protein